MSELKKINIGPEIVVRLTLVSAVLMTIWMVVAYFGFGISEWASCPVVWGSNYDIMSASVLGSVLVVSMSVVMFALFGLVAREAIHDNTDAGALSVFGFAAAAIIWGMHQVESPRMMDEIDFRYTLSFGMVIVVASTLYEVCRCRPGNRKLWQMALLSTLFVVWLTTMLLCIASGFASLGRWSAFLVLPTVFTIPLVVVTIRLFKPVWRLVLIAGRWVFAVKPFTKQQDSSPGC